MIKIIIKESLDLINESVSSIAFHYRKLNEAVNILRNDEFICGVLAQDISGDTPSIRQQFLKDKFYFLSLTRSPINSYIRPAAKTTNPDADQFISLECAFELDGDKLKNKYRSTTIDYFNYYANKSYKPNLSKDEMEDRILTDEPTIKDAHKYIKSVHVKVDSLNKKVQIIEEICKSKGIKICLYHVPDSSKISPKKLAYGNLAGRFFSESDDDKKKELRLRKGIYFSVKEMQDANPSNLTMKYPDPNEETYSDKIKMISFQAPYGFLSLISNMLEGTPIPPEDLEGAKEVKDKLTSAKENPYKIELSSESLVNTITTGSSLRNYKKNREYFAKLIEQIKKTNNVKKLTREMYKEFIHKMGKRVADTDFNFDTQPAENLSESKITIKIKSKIKEAKEAPNLDYGVHVEKEGKDFALYLVDIESMRSNLERYKDSLGNTQKVDIKKFFNFFENKEDETNQNPVVIGFIEVKDQNTPETPCLKALDVAYTSIHEAHSGKGIGKLMYKLAMANAAKTGKPLMPDRLHVEPAAANIWNSFSNDPTIYKTFDNNGRPVSGRDGEHTEEVASYLDVEEPKRTKVKIDDCSASSGEPYGIPLNRAYYSDKMFPQLNTYTNNLKKFVSDNFKSSEGLGSMLDTIAYKIFRRRF